MSGEVMCYDKDLDEVWIGIEGQERVGIMVAPQEVFESLKRGDIVEDPTVVGFRKGYPLME